MNTIQPKYILIATQRLSICAPTLSHIAAIALGMVALAASTFTLRAQPITVPNFSFETQSGVGFPFGTNPSVDSWAKIPEPAFYTPAFGSFGIAWYQTAGVFVDTNPYLNHDGTQAGYLLAVPQVRLRESWREDEPVSAVLTWTR